VKNSLAYLVAGLFCGQPMKVMTVTAALPPPARASGTTCHLLCDLNSVMNSWRHFCLVVDNTTLCDSLMSCVLMYSALEDFLLHSYKIVTVTYTGEAVNAERRRLATTTDDERRRWPRPVREIAIP